MLKLAFGRQGCSQFQEVSNWVGRIFWLWKVILFRWIDRVCWFLHTGWLKYFKWGFLFCITFFCPRRKKQETLYYVLVLDKALNSMKRSKKPWGRYMYKHLSIFRIFTMHLFLCHILLTFYKCMNCLVTLKVYHVTEFSTLRICHPYSL